jgi:hypothetical protein
LKGVDFGYESIRCFGHGDLEARLARLQMEVSSIELTFKLDVWSR